MAQQPLPFGPVNEIGPIEAVEPETTEGLLDIELEARKPLQDLSSDSSRSSEASKDEPKRRANFFIRLYFLLRSYLSTSFFPPGAPIETQLWKKQNLAIPVCYLMVGLVEGLSASVLNTYPLEIGATEAQQVTVKVLKTLPASFKIVFGFISDAFPLFGYRRKVYMGVGWIIAGLSCLVLGIQGTPGIGSLSLFMFLNSLGFWMGDVMGDSLVAERAKFETPDRRGHLQSTCYACRFFMLFVTVCLSTLLYEIVTPRVIFFVLAIFPTLVLTPCIYLLEEERNIAVPTIPEQCKTIWSTVSSRSVWQPMAFVYLYNLFQIGNAAWNQYLYTVLNFSTLQINSFMITAFALTFLGILTYKRFCRSLSWRKIYYATTSMNTLFSTLQFLLIFGVNRKWGISDYAFAMGDDVMKEFISGIQFLPTAVMMVHLCPPGSEGLSYAMFTTVSNSAGVLAGTISTLLLGIWNVGIDAFKMDPPYLGGFWRLSLLTTCIQTCAILLVPLLPHRPEDLRNMNFERKSFMGGAIFVGVMIFSLFWAILSSVLNVVKPDWAGAG
jgi:MFS family permease